MFTYLQNLVKLRRGDLTLTPRPAVYYATMRAHPFEYLMERLHGNDVSVYGPS